MTRDITAVQTIQEVSALLAVPNSRILAGGTTLSQDTTDELNLVDIKALEGLAGIKQKGTRIEIGPLTTLSEIAGSSLIKTCVPVLAEAAANVGTAELREQATLGGNLAASPAGDTAAALLASGAKLTIKTDSDYREILVDRFWDQDGKNGLQYDEWLTRITVQLSKETVWGAAFGKYGNWGQSKSAAAAVQLSLNEKNIITSIRGGLRLGTHLIRRMFAMEKVLKNHPAVDENLEKAARAMLSAAGDVTNEESFTSFLFELLQRALSQAKERRTL